MKKLVLVALIVLAGGAGYFYTQDPAPAAAAGPWRWESVRAASFSRR